MNKNRLRIFSISTDKQTKIRVPPVVLGCLKEAAYENGRSFNNEVLFRLVKSLENENSLSMTKGENNENQ